MSETMLEIAKGNLDTAKFLLQRSDERSLKISAYLIQQSSELALKHCYCELGKDFLHTHSITKLMCNLPELESYINSDIWEELEYQSGVLTSWETQTRYPADFAVTRKILSKNIELIDRFITEVDKDFGYHNYEVVDSEELLKMNLFKNEESDK